MHASPTGPHKRHRKLSLMPYSGSERKPKYTKTLTPNDVHTLVVQETKTSGARIGVSHRARDRGVMCRLECQVR